jgi:hypothetical protein
MQYLEMILQTSTSPPEEHVAKNMWTSSSVPTWLPKPDQDQDQAPAKLYYVEKRQIARGSALPPAPACRSVAALSPDTDPARMLMLAWHGMFLLLLSSAERVLEALGCGASEGASQPLLSRKILRGVVSYGTVRVTTWLCLESSVPFCLPCYSAFVSYFSF